MARCWLTTQYLVIYFIVLTRYPITHPLFSQSGYNETAFLEKGLLLICPEIILIVFLSWLKMRSWKHISIKERRPGAWYVSHWHSVISLFIYYFQIVIGKKPQVERTDAHDPYTHTRPRVWGLSLLKKFCSILEVNVVKTLRRTERWNWNR